MGPIKPLHAALAAIALVAVGAAVWLVFFRAPASLGVTAAPARESGVYRVATYNVEGLFDPNDDPRLRGENDDVPSDDEHLDSLARAIRLIDADILALQDVESREAALWFRDTYLGDMGYEHIAAIDVGHERGSENAVLSRFPITEEMVWPDLRLGGKHPTSIEGEPNEHRGEALRFRRSPLMVRIDLPSSGSPAGTPLTLFSIELKGGNKYEYWREAETRAILRLVNESVGPGRPVVLLGSFHAEPGDPSIEALLAAGFVDVLGENGEADRWVTETSGDRTDLVLANRNALAGLDTGEGFVLGVSLKSLHKGSAPDATHFPVVIGLRADQR